MRVHINHLVSPPNDQYTTISNLSTVNRPLFILVNTASTYSFQCDLVGSDHNSVIGPRIGYSERAVRHKLALFLNVLTSAVLDLIMTSTPI